ncbi:MAG: cell division protein ZapA [Bacteroidales bacterium]|jgi:cell division protein ZapA|nr:cell division protein ZapA [Bacteroidales bacterium]MCK9448146.1 cell division protein ZapA [Bacteroidales bacterium]MDD3700538.1 cell division protein ZapA [Bacteroidales bacterium]MDY0368338.1 cell division protein ZapA [Bacteroidales bacterium]
MDKITINITIADRPYRLTITRGDEEVLRKVAVTINEQLKQYAERYAYKDRQDLLAMVAIQYATSSLKNESELAFRDIHLTEKLETLDQLLSAHLTD